MNKREAKRLFGELPCDDAMDWLKTVPDLKTAWKTCVFGDWMWWALVRTKMPTKEQSVAFARWCAKRAKKGDPTYYAFACTVATDAAEPESSQDVAGFFAASVAEWSVRANFMKTSELKAQANWIRKHIPYPLEEE